MSVAALDSRWSAEGLPRRVSAGDRIRLALRPNRLAILGGLAVAAATLLALLAAWAFISLHPCPATTPSMGDGDLARAQHCYFDLYTKVYWQHWVPRLLQWTAVLPGLAALAWGVPVAREFEQRTHLIAWGQDVSPRQWLAAKTAALLTLAGASAALVALPANALAHAMQRARLTDSVLLPSYFETGISTQVGYAVLATAIGLLAGLALRRTLPAVAAAAVGYVTIRLGLLAARPHLLPISTVTGPVDNYPSNPAGSWFLGDGYLTVDGRRLTTMPGTCFHQPWRACLREHRVNRHYTDFQPTGHLVWLRLVEAGLCLAFAAAAVLISFYLLRRLTR